MCLAAARVGMGGEERVEERHVPERDVAHGHVVVTGVFGFDTFESLYPHPFFGMQVLQDQPRGGVFLEAGDLRVGVVEIHGIDENPVPALGSRIRFGTIRVSHIASTMASATFGGV